jgi:hypothetical protein
MGSIKLNNETPLVRVKSNATGLMLNPSATLSVLETVDALYLRNRQLMHLGGLGGF